MQRVLEIKDLHISFNGITAIDCLSYSVSEGETVALVGESGSGKSVSSLATMGLLPKNANISATSMTYSSAEGANFHLLNLREEEFRTLRGAEIAMIFQEPMSALNPSMTCGKQVAEILVQHKGLSKAAAKAQTIALFEKVRIPLATKKYDAYPYELSGGQRQRVVIAMAIACKPRLIIADEPTTALDVTVQKEVLLLLKDLQKEFGMAMIFISHDLGVVKEIADKIVVLYRGKTIESGLTNDLIHSPQQAYTKGLLGSRPPVKGKPKRLPTVQDFLNNIPVDHQERPNSLAQLESQSPILEITNLHKWFGERSWFSNSKGTFHALKDINLKVYPGETIGLVGESGCGKTTLGRCIVRLLKPENGEIFYNGQDISRLSGKRLRNLRSEIQYIFQDPFASLQPRMKVGEAIAEPMEVHKIGKSHHERKEKVLELLSRVGLDRAAYDKYPHEFSGGQRQRIGIARTLAVNPKLIICDESVSALDVSVQAQVLNLLNELKESFGFTYIFISHDLNVVRYMSDHLVVMQKGTIKEYGPAEDVYLNPQSTYTKELIESIPKL